MKNRPRKRNIIALVGPSGCGKTSVAFLMKQRLNIPMVVSHTTRPIRPGEVDGVDHHFVSKYHDISEKRMVSRTTFGGHDYFLLRVNIPYGNSIFIVDEEGLIKLKKHNENFKVFSIYIQCSNETLINRGISPERIARDKQRILLSPQTYNAIVHNETTLEELYTAVAKRIQHLL